jgi:hypothetical protein
MSAHEVSLLSLPTEIKLEIFTFLDTWTRLTLLRVCRHFRHLIQTSSSGQLVIALGHTVERVLSSYQIQPFWEADVSSGPPRPDLFRRFNRCPKLSEIAYTFRFAYVQSFLAHLATPPFAHLDTLILHLHQSTINRRPFILDHFVSLRTLEIHLRLKPIRLIQLQQSDTLRLPRLTRLVLYGYFATTPLITCPNLITFKCESEQFARLARFDLAQLHRQRRCHGLQRLHLWHHEQQRDLVVLQSKRTWRHVMTCIRKVTLRILQPDTFDPSIVVFRHVPRLSYKFPEFEKGWHQDTLDLVSIDLLDKIKRQIDLGSVHVSFNGLRLHSTTSTAIVRNFLLKVLTHRSESLQSLSFDRNSVDRLRSRAPHYIWSYVFDDWNAEWFMSVSTWPIYIFYHTVDQKLFDRLPSQCPNICHLRLMLRTNYDLIKVDLAFLFRMRNLNRLILFQAPLSNADQLVRLCQQSVTLINLELQQPTEPDLIDRLLTIFKANALANPHRLYKIVFDQSDITSEHKSMRLDNLYLYAINLTEMEYLLVNQGGRHDWTRKI